MRRVVNLIVLSLIAAVLFLGRSSTAAGPATTAPTADAAHPRFFDFREATLDNGLKVVTLEDFSAPVVSVQVWYHVGAKDEDPQRQGFAHMFEHMMFRGTERYTGDEFDRVMHQIGAQNNAYTSEDKTVYHEELPANQLGLALWFEAERMAFLKIDQESFDTERKIVEEERRLGLNAPYGDVEEKLLPHEFHVHPYRWPTIGNIPMLRASTVPELRAFWTAHYVPNNAVLVIAGAVKHDEAQRLAKQFFGWIPRQADPRRVTVKEPAWTEPRAVTIKATNAPSAQVSVIFRSVPAGHADEPALDMLATILANGDSSRLYRQLVVDEQKAVKVDGYDYTLEDDGLFGLDATLPPDATETATVIKEIQAQIDRVRTTPVSDEELTKARNQALRDTVTELLTNDKKASRLGYAAEIWHNTEMANTILDRIRAVTVADIQRVAQKYLDPQRVLVVTIPRSGEGARATTQPGEDASPITGKPETRDQAPPPGRVGEVRPPRFPATMPIAALATDYKSPHYIVSKLSNGLPLVIVPNKKAPFISVTLGLYPGALADTRPGVASMTLDMLTQGTQHHSEEELSKLLDTYAISLGGTAEMDASAITASCLTEQFGRTMSLLAEVVHEPTFPNDKLEIQRGQRIEQLAEEEADPGYLASRQLRREMFRGTPYARTTTGDAAEVKLITGDDLKQWWAKYARPDMAMLVIAGDVDEQTATAEAEKALGAWKATGERPAIPTPRVTPTAATHIVLVDVPDSVQSQIRVAQLGITRDDPAFAAMRVVSEAFGGDFSSRLNYDLRVQQGLTYGAFGGNDAMHYAGTFVARTFSRTASTAKAVQAAIEQMRKLKADPPAGEELAISKSALVGGEALSQETPQQTAATLWRAQVNGLPLDFYEKLLTRMSQVTDADARAVVQKTLDPDKLVVIVAGDAKKVKSELEKIAPVTVVSPPPPATMPAGK